ncbi:peptidoglycan DD-metalloendopeptidase family protein [Crenobacter caeni]|uniref:Peptidoglycan DD-metalloendopeptidase family protein n=1 Tax=Crenobacter caeni TaxID=2705474 RepID=A0A6B2KT97_9NEIS|nr:peptidoglycan DD-metalloendopeptidase family protein [Crenobacter caeni]NDV13280.1 peptidoglycan DD-metalloendopeptidase family protein [Crenobacter caeni]
MLFRSALLRLVPLSLAALLTACAGTSAYPPVSAGHYRVQPGDTLFSIARRHGRSVAELTRWNRIANPAELNAGQVLRVIPPPTYAGSPSVSTAPKRPSAGRPVNPPKPAPARPAIKLDWPLKGPLIARFSSRNKGVDIAAKLGDPVRVASPGKVVYAGQGIRAYGNLLIVKHDEHHLTAYAHNQRLLVGEGQTVRRGQQIATAGSSGADRVKLHFEVRVRGQAVDPLPYLN